MPEPQEEPPRKRLKPSDESSAPGRSPVLGLAVALCCHHRCEWRHYVGQQFFLQRGLGAEEFSAFCRMSSWATCGLRAANESADEDDHQPTEETDAVNG